MTNTRVQDLVRLAGESLGTRRDPRSQRMLVVVLALARRLGSQRMALSRRTYLSNVMVESAVNLR
jgi:hypothetical protein